MFVNSMRSTELCDFSACTEVAGQIGDRCLWLSQSSTVSQATTPSLKIMQMKDGSEVCLMNKSGKKSDKTTEATMG